MSFFNFTTKKGEPEIRLPSGSFLKKVRLLCGEFFACLIDAFEELFAVADLNT